MYEACRYVEFCLNMDVNLQFQVPFMNTEPAIFSILSFWAFLRFRGFSLYLIFYNDIEKLFFIYFMRFVIFFLYFDYGISLYRMYYSSIVQIDTFPNCFCKQPLLSGSNIVLNFLLKETTACSWRNYCIKDT
jgi:hypothetical protein